MVALLLIIAISIVGLLFLIMLAKTYIYIFPAIPIISLSLLAASVAVFFMFNDHVLQVLLFFSINCITMYYGAVRRQKAKNQN